MKSTRIKRWLDAWLHSDLVGIPFTLAAVLLLAVSGALYLVIGKVAGLFVGKLVFILALGALLGLAVLLRGRRGETTEGMSKAPADGARRLLVIANEGLEDAALCAEVCERATDRATEAFLVAPVVPSSPLHALTDDVDRELLAADQRLGTALDTLRSAGVKATGRPDIGPPMRCLVDGLREFPATEVVMVRGGESGWRDAERFAERVKAELELPVTEVTLAAPVQRAA
jgi:hypothetical protein